MSRSAKSQHGNRRHSAGHDSGFVAYGYRRARAAADPEIRAQVLTEYAERLAAAVGFWQRFWARRAIEREIDRRLDKIAPPDALY